MLCQRMSYTGGPRLRIKKSGREEEMMDIAKLVYLGLWTLVVDAKTRKRTPDGSIITPQQEEEERRMVEENTLERARVWAKREKHM